MHKRDRDGEKIVPQSVFPQELQPFSVLGVPVHLTHDYLGWLVSQAAQQRGCHVVTLNAEMTMQAGQNPQLAEIIQQAELVIPDGSGIVLYLKLYGKQVERRPGIELAEPLAGRRIWARCFSMGDSRG